MKSILDMNLSINRSGEFIAHSDADHPQQCGKVGARHYRYFVTITASNKQLTADGFVMDNAYVDYYFQKCYADGGDKLKCDSCENMAQKAVEHFYTCFQTLPELAGVEVNRIYVRIHGADISFIEAEWKK